MKTKDQLRFVQQNMKKNKTRLFMTVLATAMGCAFLIVLASVGFGLQQSIVDRIVGDRLVTAIDIYGKQADNGTDQITDQDITYFRTLDHVKAVTYRNAIMQHLHPAIDGNEVPFEGAFVLDFAAEEKAGYKLEAGRLPTGPNEAVIGFNFGETGDESESPTAAGSFAQSYIGATLTLHVSRAGDDGKEEQVPLEVAIVGVTGELSREWQKDKKIYFGEDVLVQIEAISQSRFGQFPIETSDEESGVQQAEGVLGLSNERDYQSVQIIATSAKYVKELGEQLRERGYYNHSIANELEQVNLVFLIMKIGLVFVGTIAILIASIGIFNTMTMAVTERAQDIGIMKAIGAHPSTIRRIFLLESSLIGLLGALIGTIIAYVLSIVVNAVLPPMIQMFMEQQVPVGFKFSHIPLSLTAIACVISLGVAILSGARPARRATRVEVLRALRRDV
ncbi:FtsX-like permease family protein [Paenibacillaceae bacterium]|nr:FtsX-like permease family protein [Paenibacillaceae bacterium]